MKINNVYVLIKNYHKHILDSEQGLYSLYEFIYSCRDSYISTYPTPKDPSFTNALKMLKKLKDEVDSGTYNNK